MATDVLEMPRGHFRPEFINRINTIIVYHALGHVTSLTGADSPKPHGDPSLNPGGGAPA